MKPWNNHITNQTICPVGLYPTAICLTKPEKNFFPLLISTGAINCCNYDNGKDLSNISGSLAQIFSEKTTKILFRITLQSGIRFIQETILHYTRLHVLAQNKEFIFVDGKISISCSKLLGRSGRCMAYIRRFRYSYIHGMYSR